MKNTVSLQSLYYDNNLWLIVINLQENSHFDYSFVLKIAYGN
jgi:hypothetical protein